MQICCRLILVTGGRTKGLFRGEQFLSHPCELCVKTDIILPLHTVAWLLSLVLVFFNHRLLLQ